MYTNTCNYVSTYVSICMYTLYMYISINICIDTYECVLRDADAYIYLLRTTTHAYMYVYKCIQIRLLINACLYKYVYNYIQTHTDMYPYTYV